MKKTFNVKSSPIVRHDSPEEAIRYSQMIDKEYRTINNESVSGKEVTGIMWGIDFVSFQLDGVEYLNMFCVDDVLYAELDSIIHRGSLTESQDLEVTFIMDENKFEWCPADIVSSYINKHIDKMWFLRDEILVYFLDSPILSFRTLQDLDCRMSILYWSKTD